MRREEAVKSALLFQHARQDIGSLNTEVALTPDITFSNKMRFERSTLAYVGTLPEAPRAGIPGYLVDGPDNLQREWFAGCKAVGVTAGASAPEVLVQQVVERLREWGGETPREIMGREENVVFSLPRSLRNANPAR